MISDPGRLSADTPIARWLNKIREWCIANTITSVIGGRFERGALGTRLILGPTGGGGASVSMYKLKSVQGDYVTARTWDGENEGETDVYIAKTYRLRNSLTSEDGYTYTYDDGDNALNRKRKKEKDSEYEWEVVIPRWVADEIVYAISATTGVETEGEDPHPVSYLMVADNKAWAAPEV